MAIATLDQYIGAVKQRVQLVKTVSRTALAVTPFSVFDLAGQPGAGTLAGTSTAAGVVPTDVTAGHPTINFTTGDTYLSRVEYYGSILCRLALYDMVFKAGAYSFAGATTTLSGQPNISSRCPDYPGSGVIFGNGMEIWVEVSTAFATGNSWQVRVTYTNYEGVTGRSTIISPVNAAATLTLGRMFQLPLQAGDSGVQTIESVIVTNGGTAMTAGAFNILILRPLWFNRVPVANSGSIDDMLKVGLPKVYNDSAFFLQVQPDSTATGFPNVTIELANA